MFEYIAFAILAVMLLGGFAIVMMALTAPRDDSLELHWDDLVNSRGFPRRDFHQDRDPGDETDGS